MIDKCNYEKKAKVYKRVAVRGIIIIQGKILMVQSDKYHEYKFPGGGMEELEDDLMTLIREVKEETGCDVITSSVKEYGCVVERHIDTFDTNSIFEMESRYYLCQVGNQIGRQKLDDYETEYGYQIRYATIDDAIKQNNLIMPFEENMHTWIERELMVLTDLKSNYLIKE